MLPSDPLDGQRRMWALGDYSVIARHLLPISLDLLDAVGVRPGASLLDVGVGDGNTAIEAARRGAFVTGLDLTPQQLELAGARATAEGVTVELYEGNAEALPFDDGTFDLVVSVMGVIFAPDYERATTELARVCKPGGTVAITSWANDGWATRWRGRALDLLPAMPQGGPDPDTWGDHDELVRRLDAVGLQAKVEERPFGWQFASIAEAQDLFLEHAGPFIAFAEAVTAAGNYERFLQELTATMEESNTATDGTLALSAPYLLAVATKPA